MLQGRGACRQGRENFHRILTIAAPMAAPSQLSADRQKVSHFPPIGGGLACRFRVD
jgi:hypothetical protein